MMRWARLGSSWGVMSSEKLKKYLAYYQKTLREDPENVEARLRLATLFREMGHKSNAIEEYVTASKLLASQGLPLEAIAACKAVLEIDPTHTEVQFFLARLFALAPDAAGARVARPVAEAFRPASDSPSTPSKPAPSPITLSRPKVMTPSPDSLPTQHRPAISCALEPPSIEELLSDDILAEVEPDQDSEIDAGFDRANELPTHQYKALTARPLKPVLAQDESTRASLSIPTALLADERTRAGVEVPPLVLDELRRTTEMDAQLRRTVEFSYLDELRETQMMDLGTFSASSGLDEATSPATASRLLHASSESMTRVAPSPQEEVFEVRVFEMDEVEINSEVYEHLEQLDDLPSEPELDAPTSRIDRTTISILRSDLPEIPLFSHLSASSFVGLLTMATIEEVPLGAVILAPGHQHRSLFIVISGQVMVSKPIGDEHVRLSTMSEGDFFGEFGLLTGREHGATVTATQPSRLLIISEEAIHHIAAEDPEIWNTLWSYYHVRMLNNLMSSHAIFGKLTHEERDELLDLFELQEFVEDEVIVSPDQPCHFVYLVLFGSVELVPSRDAKSALTLREGEFFGFLPSLTDEPGKTLVRALKETTLLCLPALQFRLLTRQNTKIASELRTMLRTMPNKKSLFLTGVTTYAETGSAS